MVPNNNEHISTTEQKVEISAKTNKPKFFSKQGFKQNMIKLGKFLTKNFKKRALFALQIFLCVNAIAVTSFFAPYALSALAAGLIAAKLFYVFSKNFRSYIKYPLKKLWKSYIRDYIAYKYKNGNKLMLALNKCIKFIKDKFGRNLKTLDNLGKKPIDEYKVDGNSSISIRSNENVLKDLKDILIVPYNGILAVNNGIETQRKDAMTKPEFQDYCSKQNTPVYPSQADHDLLPVFMNGQPIYPVIDTTSNYINTEKIEVQYAKNRRDTFLHAFNSRYEKVEIRGTLKQRETVKSLLRNNKFVVIEKLKAIDKASPIKSNVNPAQQSL